jgi:hypothetical protein
MKQKHQTNPSAHGPDGRSDSGPLVLTTGAAGRSRHLLLAHGAGAPMTSPFLERLTRLLDERDITVHRFEFPYMAARRQGGTRRPPPRAETLTGAYREAIAACRSRLPAAARLFIGGKSMGGRVACLVAGDPDVAAGLGGVAVLGFPFHPPGRPDTSRTPALLAVKCPALVVQGTRDPFGGRIEIARERLPRSLRIHWIEDGDHDLAPRAASGRTHDQALREAADVVAAFMMRRRS